MSESKPTMRENPFTPTFGEVPPHMAGRDLLLRDLARAFASSRRHPNLTTAITGARGTGKTALLAAAAEEAEQRGWIAVKTIALPGMLDDILITARRAAAHLLPKPATRKASSVEIGQFASIEWENARPQTNWRNEMTDLLEQLDETNTGLLITVDEVQPKLEEMVRLVAIYQLFVAEERRVALLMAGLPHNILQLENDKTVSFLRRAQKCQLGRIADFEVKDAMLRTIEEAERSISDDALNQAVSAAGGLAFMMQLVGFRIWNQHPKNQEISAEDVESGICLANSEFEERIVKTTYEALSAGDRVFLKAMAQDEATSTTTEIAQRLGKTNSYAIQYKNRLLGQGVISEGPGHALRFDLPLMRSYVRRQEDFGE